MQFGNNNYFSTVDNMAEESLHDSMAEPDLDEDGEPIVPDEALNLTHKEIGTTTNPMGNTVESLKARIREGNRRIEFSFIGQGKGNSQQPTPESFGANDRRDIRELLDQNEMKTSTHASVHSQSLGGFTREGFSGEAREQVLKEIKKAIDFAGTATKGGAIVFHFQEWQRPLAEVQDHQFKGAKFKGFEEEEERAQKYVLDEKTGQFVTGVSKDQNIYRPVYKTAKDFGLIGKKDEKTGRVFKEDDWVDMQGNLIPINATVDRLMDRVPVYDKDTNHFKVDELKWNDLVAEAKRYEDETGEKIAPEVLFARNQMERQAAQALGSSLYHGMRYESGEIKYEKWKKQWDAYMEAKKRTPKEDHWKLKGLLPEDIIREAQMFNKDPEKIMQMNLKEAENNLRYIHESSASADAQAKEALERAKRLKTVEDYGMKMTAKTVSQAAMEAMRTYETNKDKYGLEDPLYVAPENWDSRFYGSHPEEYMNLIKESRKAMENRLKLEGYSKDEAEKKAKTHIKGTLDIGHLNLFRSNFEAKEGESPEERDKRFNKWMLHWANKLTKEGYVGHIHLADNFGYDDEHLSPGQGNVPMKEFIKLMQKNKMDDFTVEPGSYNISREVPDTLELIGSPIYGVNRRQRYNQVRGAHFGYNQPNYFVAGTYSPSNDWKPWTDVPLE